MEYKFSKKSLDELHTCHPDLQRVFDQVLRLVDVAVVEGIRGKQKQDQCYDKGTSKVKYPNSKHNDIPSNAVDVIPWVGGKGSWETKHCIFLAGIVMATANGMGIKIRWGGNWDMDDEIMTDQDFQDLAHYERVAGTGTGSGV